MDASQWRVVVIGVLYLLIFLFGVWLTRSGKPYSTIVLTIHKLISLAAAVYLGIVLYQMNKVAPLNAAEIAVGVTTGLLFLGTIATGGLLSVDRAMPSVVLWSHRITPFLTVIASAVTLYLVLGGR
jgi:hypothetical protein